MSLTARADRAKGRKRRMRFLRWERLEQVVLGRLKMLNFILIAVEANQGFYAGQSQCCFLLFSSEWELVEWGGQLSKLTQGTRWEMLVAWRRAAAGKWRGWIQEMFERWTLQTWAKYGDRKMT